MCMAGGERQDTARVSVIELQVSKYIVSPRPWVVLSQSNHESQPILHPNRSSRSRFFLGLSASTTF